jgi:hypothetical protein
MRWSLIVIFVIIICAALSIFLGPKDRRLAKQSLPGFSWENPKPEPVPFLSDLFAE